MPHFNPSDLSSRDLYKLLTGTVIPRPIAWVSTVDADGNPNLAPYSFFNAVCSNPPTVLFCPGIRAADGDQKDTYHNVQATGEFVINFVNGATAEAMNITATEVPATVNEFERAGLTPIASDVVNVPRVKESPVQYECTLNQIITINDDVGGGHIVIGTVVRMHIDDAIWQEGNYIDMDAYDAIGRLAGTGYSRITDRFDLNHFPSEVKPESE